MLKTFLTLFWPPDGLPMWWMAPYLCELGDMIGLREVHEAGRKMGECWGSWMEVAVDGCSNYIV